ncbi:FtsX-like permease family protein [Streptomyces chiangmaiensis]|uniref:FtsX-like permease family protein n=1 Tax=Streptomyces chiangmaiensis TaxID=766497 RepID=A0ABU7FQ54_9ACTN|nr:FtsX-like permease family protein [Streptomyces chiangmaiensis]MED7826221.1 FtsX-like permease family protein [Streptomyces chiangmaiensis]
MIRLGLRLTLSGGREAAARLAVIAAAVALGVGLLLSILAAINATATQNSRNAWLNTGSGKSASSQSAATADTDPLWWLLRADHFDGEIIGRVDVAATGPNSPVPPGLSHLPGPGEFYVSPALGKLLHSTPAAELADRYPGHEVGTVGKAALPGPDSLVIVIGHSPDQLAKQHDATQVTSITTITPSACNGTNCEVRAGIDNRGIKLILSVAGTALIFPVLILIGTATRLAAARREQRFAAMRLVGATPRQVSMLSAVESTIAAVIGTAVGFGLFYLFRTQLAAINLTRTPYFASDLTLRTSNILLVAIAVPVGAAIAARIALRRVQISPLGVTRRVTPRPPRVYRVVPLAAGIAELSYTIGRVPRSTNGQIWIFVPGILLVLTGLVIAGPWLTMVGARVLARLTSRPALLVAGRRLADDPKAGFRAVSGLVLALCVTSAAVGIIGSLNAERSIPKGSPAVAGALVADYVQGINRSSGELVGSVPPPSEAALSDLNSVPGVKGVLMIHTNPLGTTDPAYHGPQGSSTPPMAGLASCAELAKMPAYSTCASRAEAASVTQNYSTFGTYYWEHWPTAWPAAAISAQRLARLSVQQIVVATNGSTSAIERARTILANTYPDQDVPWTVREDHAERGAQLAGYQQLANVVILVSFPIAGCSLAVSVAGGLRDRKRPFSLLRLTGTQLGVLRRVVLLESAVPLLVVAVVAIGMGFLAAQLFVQAQFRYSIRAPGIQYYAIVLAGLVASLGVIASTMPLLKRITGPETARNE